MRSPPSIRSHHAPRVVATTDAARGRLKAIADAAHLAGFADGSHANRVCREMTGAAPSEIARALRDSTDPSKP